MSTNLPPDGTGQPEYLDGGSGAPLPAEPKARNRRTPLIAGAAVVGLAAVGVGAWAAVSFFATGPQPAEALPASTVAYASVDLDPSGGQKLEAVKFLRSFPAIQDEIDLDTDDDLREKIFDESGLAEGCDGLDYAQDVEPWLGDRAAAAAIDLGEDEPALAFVVQVKDAAEAEDGLAALRECTGDSDSPGWSIEGDWAVVAETDEIAGQVADATAKGTLADDSDYQSWTDEVGDSGIVNVFVAPEAGAFMADAAEGLMGFGMPSSYAGSCEATPEGEMVCNDTGDLPASPAMSDQMRQKLEDFGGMAISLRFDDGGLELEMAGDAGISGEALPTSDAGDDVLATLPDDTAVAIGSGFVEGWADDLIDYLATTSGMSAEELVSEAEQETGLTLPDDLETLMGDAAAFGVSEDVDPEAYFNGDGSDLPVGVKIQGDADEIEAVVEKLRASLPPDVQLVTDSEGDYVAIGVDEDYVASLLEDGGLGDTDAFDSVADDADEAAAVVFVNFDAGDWVDTMVEGDAEAQENLEPLQAFGITLSREDDVAHAVLRLTLN